jgi:serine/threonine protein kinase
MPAPTTVAEFVELVRKSGVIDEKRLDAHLEKLRAASALPAEPGKLAGVLVRDGVLTHFQATQFMQGKWRRFTIGKYKVLEQLGSGGMGMVYLCEHMLMRRRVAVKVLPANKADDPAALERFYREARAVAALDHPNIVRAYDIDHAEKLHFLVMEYVDGSSLQEMIKKAGAMDVTRACHYIRQAALGLQHAHEAANLVHRDIKPGNVLVDRNGIVKVLDMGLARFFNEDEDNITKKYDESVLGTADYLAPEQAVDSHEADIRADIYSLGATFYFCLTGRTPFAEGTVAQKLIWHQTRQPKPIRQVRPDVDEALAAIIEKMMAKRREDRYQTPLAVAEALAPWTKTPIPPPPDAEMPHLSLAAAGNTTSTTTVTPVPASDGVLPTVKPATVPSPAPRKAWQVTAPAPAAAPQPPTSRPGPAAKASPPAAPAAVPRPPAPAVQVPTVPGSTPPAASLLQASPNAPHVPVPAAVPAEEAAPWEQLASDTNPTARLDTERASGHRRSRVHQDQEAAQARRRLILILSIVGGAAVVLIALVLWLALRGKPGGTGKGSEGDRPRATLIVGSDGDYRTVADALKHANSGDRIVVQADSLREPALESSAPELRHLKRISVEAADAKKKVRWHLPPNTPGKWLFQLEEADGWRFKGFIFDGEGRLETLGYLIRCRGVTLEDIELRGFVKEGLHFINCAAPPEAPITLAHVSATSAAHFLVFEVNRKYPDGPLKNINIFFEDCTFTGGGKILKKDLKGGENKDLQLPPGIQVETTISEKR